MRDLADFVRQSLVARNPLAHEFFAREATRLARACRQMADRFARGGRLIAFGTRQYTTDAQHVAVEFVHPVIVGKRALPALDWSWVDEPALSAFAGPDDIVMAFAPVAGDERVAALAAAARRRGALVFALSGQAGDYAVTAPGRDPFVHQELIEMLYHTLWETVHVFLEHREIGGGEDLGAAGFLYPYLGSTSADPDALAADVAASIRAKAQTDDRLRAEAAGTLSTAIADAAARLAERTGAGGAILTVGNGGSATDATDLALDCLMPAKVRTPVPAVSLASDPACATAIANDIGRDAIFLRQLIAQGRRGDALIAISTSGGSGNIMAALEHARSRGMFTLALLGHDGGEIARRGLADAAIVVSCDYIPRIQEVQASIYHTLLDAMYEGGGGTAPLAARATEQIV